MKKKKWFHKVGITWANLASELNAFAEQGYEIYKIWKCDYNSYEIIAYKEETIL